MTYRFLRRYQATSYQISIISLSPCASHPSAVFLCLRVGARTTQDGERPPAQAGTSLLVDSKFQFNSKPNPTPMLRDCDSTAANPSPEQVHPGAPGAAAICNSQTPSATRPKVKSNSPITTGSQNEQTGQRQILLHVPGAWSALRAGPEGCASLPNPPLRCTVACPRQG